MHTEDYPNHLDFSYQDYLDKQNSVKELDDCGNEILIEECYPCEDNEDCECEDDIIICDGTTDDEVIVKQFDVYAGSTSVMPINGLEIKNNIPVFVNLKTIIFELNGIDTILIIAIPADKNILKVVTSNSETLYHKNNILESDFELDENIVSVPNDFNVDRPYTVYVFKTVLPFSKAMNLTITIE